jgi:hypothetical protein
LLGRQKAVLTLGAGFIALVLVAYLIGLFAAPHGFVASTVETLNYAYGFLMFATVVHLVDRWEVLRNCLWAWLASAALVSAVGMLAVVGVAPGWAYDDFTMRVSSTLKFENQVPSFLLPILPVAVVLAVARTERPARRLALALLAMAGIGTLAMTGSRVGFLMTGLFFAGLLWIAATEGRRSQVDRGHIVAAFAALVALQAGITTYALATYEGDYALGRTPPWQRPAVTLFEWVSDTGGDLSAIDESRVDQISFVTAHVVDYAVLGIGPKMIGARFGHEEIHNTYLGVLFETGVVGVVLLLLLLAKVAGIAWDAVRRTPPGVQRAVVRALLLGFVLLLLYQFTMFGLRQRNLWLLMGLLVAVPRVVPLVDAPLYPVSTRPRRRRRRRISAEGSAT